MIAARVNRQAKQFDTIVLTRRIYKHDRTGKRLKVAFVDNAGLAYVQHGDKSYPYHQSVYQVIEKEARHD